MPQAAATALKRRAGNNRKRRPGQGALPLAPNTPGKLRRFLKKQTEAYSCDLKRCQKKFSREAVHQVRVRARRLLSVLCLLEPFLHPRRGSETAAKVKQQLDLFKRLRDVQVQSPPVSEMRPRFPAAASFCRHLAKSERRLMRKARKAVQGVKIKPLARVIDELRAEVKKEEAVCPPEKMTRQLANVVEDAFSRTLRLRNAIDADRTKTIHRTRIAFKRFRYMVEALAHSTGLADQRRLAAMHDYQDMMGRIQDAEVLLRAYAKFQAKEHSDPADARSFRQELLRQRDALVRNYLARVDQLLEFRPVFSVATSS